MESRTKSRRGFALLSPEQRQRIARMGGKKAQALGTGHQYTSDEARAAGKIGGRAVAADRHHMAEIGRKGGLSKAQRRQQMNRQELSHE